MIYQRNQRASRAQIQTTITEQNGMLVFRSPYNDALISALRVAVPTTDRAWDKTNRAWIVSPQYGATLVLLAQTYLNETVNLPQVTTSATRETKMLDVRYVGVCKDRGNGERTAFGWSAGEWSVIFPESVLRAWFIGIEATPTETATLYTVLGINGGAPMPEIKSAYRRMARQWHPDVCHEPNATEQFQAIQHAYEILSDANKRVRYDAGLALEASLKKDTRKSDYTHLLALEYRAPLRCGIITAEGTNKLNRFVVDRILKWDDITNEQGQTLVVSWKNGADKFTETWVLM